VQGVLPIVCKIYNSRIISKWEQGREPKVSWGRERRRRRKGGGGSI
jgi:ribosomal protein L44E